MMWQIYFKETKKHLKIFSMLGTGLALLWLGTAHAEAPNPGAFNPETGHQAQPALSRDAQGQAAPEVFKASEYEVWEIKYDKPVSWIVCHASKQLAVGSEFSRQVCGYDLSTGKLNWQFYSTTGLGTPPLVYKDDLYLASMDMHVSCVDFATGVAHWDYMSHHKLPSFLAAYASKMPQTCRAGLAVLDEKMAMLSQFGHLSLLSTQGKEEKRFPLISSKLRPVRFVSAPSAHEGFLYCATQNGELWVIDPNKWDDQHHSSLTPLPDHNESFATEVVTPGVLNDYNYLFCTMDGSLYCYQIVRYMPESCKLKWTLALDGHSTYQTNAAGLPVVTPVKDVHSSTVYVCTRHNVNAISPKDGSYIWRTRIAEQPASAPIQIGEHLVFATEAEQILFVRKDDGRVDYALQLDKMPSCRPAHLGHHLLLGYADGTVQYINLASLPWHTSRAKAPM